MIHDHKFYEMQSALAAMGQLTETELADLEHHATSCASCRECITEMAEISREFFLMQARRMKGRSVPKGMQERFIKRAASAGISVSRSTSTTFGGRFVPMTMIAVLLAVATSFSWRVFSVSDAARKAAPSSFKSESRPSRAPEVASHVSGQRTIHVGSISNAQPRRKSAVWSNTGLISSNHRILEERPSYLEPNRPLFAWQGSPTSFSDGTKFWSDRSAARPLGALLHAPIRTSLTNAFITTCFGHRENCEPEERAFHLDLRVASLSFLDSQQSVNAESHITGQKFTAPAFDLAPTRVW
jgi:hypothetical protein